MNRTIASARAFLAGLFSLDKKDNQIQAKGPFEIEVHNFPDEDMVDIFLLIQINKQKMKYSL